MKIFKTGLVLFVVMIATSVSVLADPPSTGASDPNCDAIADNRAGSARDNAHEAPAAQPSNAGSAAGSTPPATPPSR